jgi:hypothetical protein
MIIEIYKDAAGTMWQNDETFLVVLDSQNKLLRDYDFCTGLRLMQDDNEMTAYINDEDLLSGNWIFLGTKLDENFIKYRVKSEGVKEGGFIYKKFTDPNPWENCGPGIKVSREKREERLSICKLCPQFNQEDMTCSLDGRIVLEATKYENLYCPEGKWGDKEILEQQNIAERAARGDIILPEQDKIQPTEQEIFEQELEDFLKGLE